jgi:ATP-dependent DNA helicase RecG
MKKNLLKEVVDSILGPLQYEPRNGYKDSTVSGGFSAFALKKLSQLRPTDVEPYEWKNLEKLKKALLDYQKNPSQERFDPIKALLNGQEVMVSERVHREIPTDLARKDLLRPIQFIKGIGPRRAQLFQKLGINFLLDLFYFFPRDYLDRSRIVPMNQAKVGEYQTFLGSIQDTKDFQKGHLTILNVIVYDRSGILQLTFFNQKYLAKVFSENLGKRIIFSGKVQHSFNRFSVDSPEFEFVEDERETIHSGRIVPIYRLTAGLNGKFIRLLMKNQLDEFIGSIYDFIPDEILKNLNLPGRNKAIKSLHFPESTSDLELARKRIVFEEFCWVSIGCLKKRRFNAPRLDPLLG